MRGGRDRMRRIWREKGIESVTGRRRETERERERERGSGGEKGIE